MTSGQPQGDIIIEPTYHRTPYFRQSTQSQQREKVPTFYVYMFSDQRQGPLNNSACEYNPRTYVPPFSTSILVTVYVYNNKCTSKYTRKNHALYCTLKG